MRFKLTIILIFIIRYTYLQNNCILRSEDIDINSFTTFLEYNKTVTYSPITDKGACNETSRCVISNNTRITLCLSPKDFLKLVKKMDFSNLTQLEQSLIRDFLIKLELLTLDSEDKAFFNTLCKTVLKRMFNKDSDFSFLVVCNWLDRFQHSDTLYRKLIKQNVSLVYNESHYIGNFFTEVGRSRIARNLTGKTMSYQLLKDAIENYNKSNPPPPSLLRRGFDTLVLTPYLSAINMERESYNSYYTLLKAVPTIIKESKPGMLQYAWGHAMNNATLYYKTHGKYTQQYLDGIRHTYSTIKYKIGKVFESRRGKWSYAISDGFSKTSEIIKFRTKDLIQRITVKNPYESFQLLNDTDSDLDEEDFNCTTIYWWWDIDYWDPRLSPFIGFVNGSYIDNVFYFLIIPLPPPRTMITLVDWWLAWLRRSYMFNKIVPRIALEAKSEECKPGWPYFVDTILYNTTCFYPTFPVIPYNFCPEERAIAEDGDLTYCREWFWLDEVFLGWVQFISTNLLSQYVCRVRILQVVFGWAIYKKDGVLVCDGDEFSTHLPPMMGKCLFFKFLYTVLIFIIFFFLIVILLIFFKYMFPEFKGWLTNRRINDNAEEIENLEEEVEELKEKVVVKEVEKDPFVEEEVIDIEPKTQQQQPVMIKTEGKAVNDLLI
jgi:hypothetical protein